MRLVFDGFEVPVNPRGPREEYTSLHSGRNLAKLSGNAVFRSEDNYQDFLDAVRAVNEAYETVPAVDENGDSLGDWIVKIGMRRSQEAGGSELHKVELSLYESEALDPDSVVLDDGRFELTPDEYGEYIVGEDELHVQMIVTLDEENAQELREYILESGYFPVQRLGLSEEPVEMRFGRTLWTRQDDQIRFGLPLVDKKMDEDEIRGSPAQPVEFRARADQAFAEEVLRGLLTSLVEKGVLSEEDRERINEEAEEKMGTREYDYHRVPDIEEFFRIGRQRPTLPT